MKIFAGAAATVLLLFVLLLGFGGGGAGGTGCSTTGDVIEVTDQTPPVGPWKPAQLKVAATAMRAAADMHVNQQATRILIMTGMGESSLQVLNHGDAVDNTTIGFLQQGESYGPPSARLDVTTASKAFLTKLLQVPGWETMSPTFAAHAVQINQDPWHYEPFWNDAVRIVDALTPSASGGSCAIAGDARSLATELVKAIDDGKLKFLSYPGQPDHAKEIRWIVEGVDEPDCGVDTRVLQIIVVAVRNFDSVGISDINRKCTGQIEGAGTQSAHYLDGGGHAVDFHMLDGSALTGADENSLRLIRLLDPQVEKGSRVGQADVRARNGVALQLTNFTQFSDSPNHLHIDVLYAHDTKGPIAQ